jgi:hypothetical protein
MLPSKLTFLEEVTMLLKTRRFLGFCFGFPIFNLILNNELNYSVS